MWRLLGSAAAFVGSLSYASAGSLYLTTSTPLRDGNSMPRDEYTFIAPYFTRVKTQLTVSITPAKDQPPSLLVSVSPIPAARGYLYLHKDAFFSDSVEVKTVNGLLSSSDSSSQQALSAIIQELAQLIGSQIAEFKPTDGKPELSDREICFKTIGDLAKTVPYYIALEPFESITTKGASFPVYSTPPPPPPTKDRSVQIYLYVKPSLGSMGQKGVRGMHPGMIAFFPVPATAKLLCHGGRETEPVLLTTPLNLNLYTESHFLDPQRDLLTNPTDTLTFDSGFITAHKHTSQSAAKTLVDMVTAPVRALLPTVSMQQNTQVVSSPGKPDQITTTKTTTTSSPKP